ncbi:MAG: thermonuclease family protein [Micropruina sp.]|nr:thermonuclease family protein [Micropruina sp.]
MKILAGVACLSVLSVGIAQAIGGERITVDRVVDGDTVDVRIGDKTERVRLLNIDAPETKDPDEPVECLGPEASAFLSQRLPVGTTIELRYDVDRVDRYRRTLAAVYESGKFVNAEVAQAGLAAPVVFEPNHAYYPEVLQAAQEAQGAQIGAYDPSTQCTLPSQIASATTAATGALTALGYDEPITIPRADLAITSLHLHLAPLTSLENSLQDAGSEEDPSLAANYSESELRTMIAGIEHVRQRLLMRLINLMETRTAIEEAKEKAAEEQAKEAARKAKAAKKRAEAAEKRAKAKEAAERRAAAARAAKEKVDKKDSSGNGSGGGYPGYTGPRCYAPGGKTWKPC